MIKRLKLLSTLAVSVVLLSACGTAHVRTDKVASDLHSYNNVFIQKVDIYSNEEAAKTNTQLQNKMVEWEAFARTELENYVQRSNYSLLTSKDQITERTLIVDLDVDLVYGNRAARYFGGFGAGKGSVDSVLTVIDHQTSDLKFKATAESELSMGAFGGDMQGVLKSNIKKLIQQYPQKP